MKGHDLSNAWRIAWRYFFSPKSTHAVHIIAIVAVAGIALVTVAMVVVLSVFNGFEAFTTSQLSALSPSYKLRRVDGQAFSPSKFGITGGIGVLETQAVATFEGNSQSVRVVGVGKNYAQEIPINRYMYMGDYDLGIPEAPSTVVGIGVAMNLGAGVGYSSPLEISLPKRIGRISTVNPARGFVTEQYHVSGIFQVDQDIDTEGVFLSLDEVRALLQYDGDEVSYLAFAQPVEVPAQFELLDRYQQHPEIYKVLKMEKWFSFFLLLFVLLLLLFSIISTLGMLIIEKRHDVDTLRFLGAKKAMIDLIPFLEGWLLSITGLVIGLMTGTVLVLLQAKYGFAKLGTVDTSAFVLDAYPVDFRLFDLLLISVIILVIGALSSFIAFRIFRWNRATKA
ncbi:MAG: FtsX-like permease family protein [Bacteroidales bacterium]|uniref:FtsX-like permease family protein n=1 Tax=Porphyromonas sp. TaxID=1924944 RepID=UPI0029779131|nr:FtsX-like permease family protein [Porphyromonas sp.]MDD7437591.1 FtsX-like permease family protein [Bacteroidales bacterium]MDY3066363.1 FtsX-like permease family protein [Porphyromonas sp.]